MKTPKITVVLDLIATGIALLGFFLGGKPSIYLWLAFIPYTLRSTIYYLLEKNNKK